MSWLNELGPVKSVMLSGPEIVKSWSGYLLVARDYSRVNMDRIVIDVFKTEKAAAREMEKLFPNRDNRLYVSRHGRVFDLFYRVAKGKSDLSTNRILRGEG